MPERSRAATDLRPPAHPMPGMLAVMKIPTAPDDQSEQQAQASLIGSVLGIRLSAGIVAAIVIDVGEIRSDYETYTQLVKGVKVYFADQAAVAIGDYHYVQATAVLAWEPEE